MSAGKPGGDRDFLFQMSAKVGKCRGLSISARGFYFLLRALSDLRTGQLPPWVTPDALERLADISKKKRLRLERELENFGLLVMEQPRAVRKTGGVYCRKIYRTFCNSKQIEDFHQKAKKKPVGPKVLREETLGKMPGTADFEQKAAFSLADPFSRGDKKAPLLIQKNLVRSGQQNQISKGS